jgi:phenylalanyl-tRNA synthetase alpha chain
MDIENIKKEALDKLENIKDSVDLESFKRDYLSKKGKIRDLFSLVKDLPIEEKKTLGQKINQLAKKLKKFFC